ncbi:MAG: hypothetical protein WAM28_07710 [Chlamydiales bacterium]
MLTFPPANKFTGIELQFLRGQFGLQGYLNIYSRCIPLSDPSSNAAVFAIQINNQRYRYQGFCMEGEQRLLLPRQATDQIIEALLACQTVAIYLEGFSAEISPYKFQKLYKQFSSI